MRIQPPSSPAELAFSTRSIARSNRVAAASNKSPLSTYRAPTVVRLKSSPLHKLRWIFGLH